MRKKKARIALVLWTILLSSILATPSQIIGRKTAFKDEFNCPIGSAVDASKWTYEVGGGGWGNQELEYYTNSTENGYLDGSGNLAIKAVKLTPSASQSCWYGP